MNLYQSTQISIPESQSNSLTEIYQKFNQLKHDLIGCLWQRKYQTVRELRERERFTHKVYIDSLNP